MASLPKLNKKLKEADNLGFGNHITGKRYRLLERNGKYNVRTIGGQGYSIYQDLVEMGWGRFFLLVGVFFLLVNAVFASLLLLTGMDCLSGVHEGSALQNFADAWFFSVQTLTTVGYGSVSPTCFSSNVVASLIALTGLLTFALVTGLFFARFSKPVAQLRFSGRAVIAPYRPEANGFMFRIANRRDNQMINVTAKAVMSWVERQTNDEPKRRFAPLELELDRVAMLPLNWTIVHPITPTSPLHGKLGKDLEKMEVKIIALLSGHDESYSQEVHANHSYNAEEIACGFRFLPMYYPGKDGRTVLDMGKIDDVEEAKLMHTQIQGT